MQTANVIFSKEYEHHNDKNRKGSFQLQKGILTALQQSNTQILAKNSEKNMSQLRRSQHFQEFRNFPPGSLNRLEFSFCIFFQIRHGNVGSQQKENILFQGQDGSLELSTSFF